MSKLKIRFMIIVCQFISDWYKSQIVPHANRTHRLSNLDKLVEDLQTEYEEE